MSDFEEFMLWCWMVLVTIIYPIFLFKGMKQMREQIERLSAKLASLKHLQSREEEAEPRSPAPQLEKPSLVKPAEPPEAAVSLAQTEEKLQVDVATAAAKVIPPPLPRPQPPPVMVASPVQKEPSAFELAAKGLWSRIWNWILVGEEYRKPGVSVEFAVATNWLVRVGVLVLVVGVGFFLDYSARMGWLGDVGKVTLAGAVGAGLIGWGILNLNRKYHLLGQGLVGAGLAILYATMFAAHQRYELISPVTAFVAMFLVTLGAAGISIFGRSLLIAVLGIIGGYLTPFLLPDSGEVAGLLVYLAVLGGGVLLISIRRQWFVLNFLAFLFTSLHMLAMLEWWQDPVAFKLAMPFLVIYFLIFSTSSFLFQVLQKEKATWIDLAFMLMNAGVFALCSRALILENFDREWMAVVTASLAIFYGMHLWVFMNRKGVDRGLALCFMSLMSFFCLITVPILISDDYWSLSWALMGVVFLMASQKVCSRFLEQIAFGILMLSVYRFLQQDLGSVYREGTVAGMPLSVYLTALGHRLVLVGVPLAALAVALRLQSHPLKAWPEFQITDENDSGTFLFPSLNAWVLRVSLLILGFVTLHLEVVDSFRYLFAPAVPSVLTLVWVGAGWVLLGWYKRDKASEILRALVMIFAACLVLKWGLVDLNDWGLNLSAGRFEPYSLLDAGMRLLDAVLRCGFLLYCFVSFGKEKGSAESRLYFGYLALGSFWVYSTLEVKSMLSSYVPGLASGGLSVFWGLFALCLVSVGLFKRYRPLRLIGLMLFAWVAVKVFFVDMASLDPIYKIVAFIVLGVVLLAGAFVYLRFQDRFALDSERE